MITIRELIRKAYLIRSQITGDKSNIEEIIDWLEEHLKYLESEKECHRWQDENNRDSGEPWI